MTLPSSEPVGILKGKQKKVLVDIHGFNGSINKVNQKNTHFNVRRTKRSTFALLIPFVIFVYLRNNIVREGNWFNLHMSDLHGRTDAYENRFVFADAEGSARIILQAAQTPRPIFDEAFNETVEMERCQRYNFQYSGRRERRRIFWGSLIADDSWHTLSIVALETYGLFHSVAFVESNRTQMNYKREIRFGPDSEGKKALESGMFGPNSPVTVDYYVEETGALHSLGREHAQRSLILERWKKNGMTADDIGYLSDADETFSRDFLRALQICNVKEFESHNHCNFPKIGSSSLVFEGSPNCLVQRRWFHPDVIIGECIDTIGNVTKHPKVERTWKGYGWLDDGYKRGDGFSKLPENSTHFPLFNGADFRRTPGTYYDRKFHTGYHFHNFFPSIDVIRRKYKTYGHPVRKADTLPLEEIHDDLAKMVNCVLNRSDTSRYPLIKGGINAVTGPLPLAFKFSSYLEARHAELKAVMLQYVEETMQKNITNDTTPA